MRSMFRSPQEISSSESESDDSSSEEEESEVADGESRLDHPDDPSLFTEGSITPSGGLEAGSENQNLGFQGIPDVDAEGHAALMTAALLEHYCVTKAVDTLNEQSAESSRFTRDSPEAILLGRQLYSSQSRFLSSHGVVVPGVEGDDWQRTRQYYRDGLDRIGSAALEALNLNKPTYSTRVAADDPENPPTTLAIRANDRQDGHSHIHDIKGMMVTHTTNFNLQRLIAGGSALEYHHIFPPQHIPMQRTINLPYFHPQPIPSTVPTSRYVSEFEEECLIGRGSFGVVYKVRHHVDGQGYAVKKIPLNPKKLQQMQERGLKEVDNILKEIRTLAQLQHTNVVRYYGAWAEYSPATALHSNPPTPHTNHILRPQNLLSRHSSYTREDISSHGVAFAESDHGIIFESSEPQSSNQARLATSSRRLDRRRSIHEISSGHSGDHNTKSEQNGSLNDEDVESLPRRLNFTYPSQPSSIADSEEIFSDGFGGCRSNMQLDRRAKIDPFTPTVTVHIQMSLYPLSLAKYLYPKPENRTTDKAQHCFHLVPSLKILLGILAGVEYLHVKGIIHRDLKPANVFLSPPELGERMVRCPNCELHGHEDKPQYTTPSIGDFGLVAETSRGKSSFAPSHPPTRPVGTEFYHPPTRFSPLRRSDTLFSPQQPSDPSQADESLDVYALGVILFELLYKLDTRMERQMVLSTLTCSSGTSFETKSSCTEGATLRPGLPSDFTTKVHENCPLANCCYERKDGGGGDSATIPNADECGCGKNRVANGFAERLAMCVLGMVEPDVNCRWTCAKVRRELEDILELVERQTH
ncbi:hypothetical protein FQN57_003756 [Myotisia sp. PD_48]|nr:hypothetical protein FQN57_003756 [Myotisia sp. PD_48]